MDWLSLDKATCENCFYSDNDGKCTLQSTGKKPDEDHCLHWTPD